MKVKREFKSKRRTVSCKKARGFSVYVLRTASSRMVAKVRANMIASPFIIRPSCTSRMRLTQCLRFSKLMDCNKEKTCKLDTTGEEAALKCLETCAHFKEQRIFLGKQGENRCLNTNNVLFRKNGVHAIVSSGLASSFIFRCSQCFSCMGGNALF